MWRALRLHLLSLTSLVASSVWIIWALGDALPPTRRNAILALCAGYAAAWLFLLGLRVAQRRRRARRAWRTHDRAIMWLANFAISVSFPKLSTIMFGSSSEVRSDMDALRICTFSAGPRSLL